MTRRTTCASRRPRGSRRGTTGSTAPSSGRRFALFSDQNPMMQPIKQLADSVRDSRRPVGPDNPLLAVEHAVSTGVAAWLKAWGDWRDTMTEVFFLSTYGSPLLQAMVGLGPQNPPARRHIERDLVREAAEARLRSELD